MRGLPRGWKEGSAGGPWWGSEADATAEPVFGLTRGKDLIYPNLQPETLSVFLI